MADFERILARMLVPPDSGVGRTLDELTQSDDILSGQESQRLRTYFSTTSMEPYRDLDAFGWTIMNGDVDQLKATYAADDAAQEIYSKRWGPTRVPVFNLILLSAIINSSRRRQHLEIARWLSAEVKVAVDGTDLSGSTALHHSISTKPTFDPEFAQILYDAGADVNHRNRYGGTPAHEITIIWNPSDEELITNATAALKWFLEHGGNVDIKDSDGQTARKSVDISRGLAARGLHLGTWKVVDDDDARRRRLTGQVCAFCGRGAREAVKLLTCARCKTARYCSPGLPCQKTDWPHHKSICKKAGA